MPIQKKKTYNCPQCYRVFQTERGLNIHRTMAKHFSYHSYHTKPEPEMKHIAYKDIVSNSYASWGKKMIENERRHPSDTVLIIASLIEIIALLHELIDKTNKK